MNLALVRSLEDANWWVRRNCAAALTALPGGNELLFEAIGFDDPYARDAAVEALAGSGAWAPPGSGSRPAATETTTGSSTT